MTVHRGWETDLRAAAAPDRLLDHPPNCSYGNFIPGSDSAEPTTVRLAEAPVGTRVRLERVSERLDPATGLPDDLKRHGLVSGLTVSVLEHRADGAVCVRTGRGDRWVDREVARYLLVTLGDLNEIADRLRARDGSNPSGTRAAAST